MAFPDASASHMVNEEMVIEAVRGELREIAADLEFLTGGECPLSAGEREPLIAELTARKLDLIASLPADLRLIMDQVIESVGGSSSSAAAAAAAAATIAPSSSSSPHAPGSSSSTGEDDYLVALRLQAEYNTGRRA